MGNISLEISVTVNTSVYWPSEKIVRLRLKLGFIRNMQKCNSDLDFWLHKQQAVAANSCG